MSTFDQSAQASNGSLTHIWLSREGRTDQFLHFPSPTYGIDANRTFEVRITNKSAANNDLYFDMLL